MTGKSVFRPTAPEPAAVQGTPGSVGNGSEPGLRIRGRLLARNTLLNLAGQGLPLAIGVVSIPFVADGLGAARFGVLALAWMALGYLNIFDLGLSVATTKFVAEVLGRGERERVAPIAWTTMFLQTGLAVLGAALLAAAAPLLAERILNVPQELVAETRTTFYVLAAAVPAVLLFNSFRGVLEAAQRFDLVNAVRAPFNAANFLLPLAGVLAGWGLAAIVGALVAARYLALGVLYALCRRQFPSLGGLPRFARSEARALVGFGGWVTISSLVSPFLVYLDRFLLGALVTVAAVGYYSAPYEMVLRLLVIPWSLVGTLYPAISTIGALGDPGRLDGLVSRSVKYLLFIVGPIALLLAVHAHGILELWLGAEFAREGALAVRILAAGVLANALAQVPYSLLQGLGRPDLPAKFHLLELLPHVLVAWAAISAWGVAGAALAWTIRVTLDSVLLYGAGFRRLPGSLRAMAADRVPGTVALLAGMGAFLAMAAALPLAPWAEAGLLAGAALPAGWVAWRWLLQPEERAPVTATLRRSARAARGRATT